MKRGRLWLSGEEVVRCWGLKVVRRLVRGIEANKKEEGSCEMGREVIRICVGQALESLQARESVQSLELLDLYSFLYFQINKVFEFNLLFLFL